MYPYVHCRITPGSQDVETNAVSFGGQLAKEDVVHTYGGTLIKHKKSWYTAMAMTWIDLESMCIMLNEIL